MRLRKLSCKSSKNAENWVKGFTDKLTKYQDSLQSLHPRTQIVRVKQIASSYIMNAPAHWNASYDGNKETSNGKGATNELFSVIRLSDGKIIKSFSFAKQRMAWCPTRRKNPQDNNCQT